MLTPLIKIAVTSADEVFGTYNVHLADEFPMTITGKIRKVEMHAAAIEILGLRHASGTRDA